MPVTSLKYGKLTGLNPPQTGTDAASKDYIDQKLGITYSIAIVDTPTYTAPSSDTYITIKYTSSGPVTITLPLITEKLNYHIIDEGGNAGINIITINATFPNKILDSSSIEINNNFSAISLYNNGTTTWLIS